MASLAIPASPAPAPRPALTGPIAWLDPDFAKRLDGWTVEAGGRSWGPAEDGSGIVEVSFTEDASVLGRQLPGGNSTLSGTVRLLSGTEAEVTALWVSADALAEVPIRGAQPSRLTLSVREGAAAFEDLRLAL